MRRRSPYLGDGKRSGALCFFGFRAAVLLSERLPAVLLCVGIAGGVEEVTASMLDADEAEVRAVLSFKGLVCRVKREDVVTGARVSALDPEKLAALPGIVAYIVQEGDSLWEIGKKYYVPAAKMKEMNGLAGEEPKAGDKLLIVKGR